MESGKRMDSNRHPDRTHPPGGRDRHDIFRALPASVALHVAVVILALGSVRLDRAEPPLPVIDLGLVSPMQAATGHGSPARVRAAANRTAPASHAVPPAHQQDIPAPSTKEPPTEERSGGGAREAAEAPAPIALAPAGPATGGATGAESAAGAPDASRTDGTPAAAEAWGPRSVATEGGSVPGRAYGFIRSVIQQGVSYPVVARRMGWEGRVIVAFRILQDGTVRDIRVVEGSGHAVLDRSAVEAVRSASPFPHPPAEAEVVTPVVYKLF